MTETHHCYRPILRHSLYTEFMGDDKQGQDSVSECYNNYLAKNQTVTGVSWMAAELVWHEKGAKTVRLDPQMTLGLLAASASLDVELPPLPERECQAICYELPLAPRLPLGGSALTSFLAVHGENDLIVWQGENDLTRGEILEPGELCKRANEPIAIPENLIEVGIPAEQMSKVENRRMAIIAYHLCRGLDWFSDYIAQHTRVSPDGSVIWQDQPHQ